MSNYIKLLRVKHWIKNVLIFIPMICARQVNPESIGCCLLAFLSFSLLSSTIYILNDLRDMEQDRLHPRKKHRPLASGAVKPAAAIILMAAAGLLSLGCNVVVSGGLLNLSFAFWAAYFLINLGYSLGLKNVALMDITLLSAGFVLRVYYGAAVLDIAVSSWLFLTIMSASVFMGLGKRRKELIYHPDARKVLKEYNEAFLTQFQFVSLTMVLVFYALWAVQQEIAALPFTVPLVLLVLMRYCLIVEKSEEGDPTTILFGDKALLLLSGVYGIVMLWIFLV